MAYKYASVGGEIGKIINNPQALADRFDQFAKDTKYLDSIGMELREQFPDQWVAVYREQVVANSPSLKGIMRKLDKGDIPRGRVALQFVRSKPIAMIL